MVEAMKKSLAVMMVLLLVLSGCLGFGGNDDEDVEQNTNLGLDTDGDGLLDTYDSDDDNDRWEDIDELNCMSDPLDATDVPLDFDNDWFCDVRDLTTTTMDSPTPMKRCAVPTHSTQPASPPTWTTTVCATQWTTTSTATA